MLPQSKKCQFGGGGGGGFFQRAREKSGNSISSQRSTKFYLEVSEKSGSYCHYYYFGYSHLVWERVSLLAKIVLSQKTFTKELISVASSLALLQRICLLSSLKTGLWSMKIKEKVGEFCCCNK